MTIKLQVGNRYKIDGEIFTYLGKTFKGIHEFKSPRNRLEIPDNELDQFPKFKEEPLERYIAKTRLDHLSDFAKGIEPLNWDNAKPGSVVMFRCGGEAEITKVTQADYDRWFVTFENNSSSLLYSRFGQWNDETSPFDIISISAPKVEESPMQNRRGVNFVIHDILMPQEYAFEIRRINDIAMGSAQSYDSVLEQLRGVK